MGGGKSEIVVWAYRIGSGSLDLKSSFLSSFVVAKPSHKSGLPFIVVSLRILFSECTRGAGVCLDNSGTAMPMMQKHQER